MFFLFYKTSAGNFVCTVRYVEDIWYGICTKFWAIVEGPRGHYLNFFFMGHKMSPLFFSYPCLMSTVHFSEKGSTYHRTVCIVSVPLNISLERSSYCIKNSHHGLKSIISGVIFRNISYSIAFQGCFFFAWICCDFRAAAVLTSLTRCPTSTRYSNSVIFSSLISFQGFCV